MYSYLISISPSYFQKVVVESRGYLKESLDTELLLDILSFFNLTNSKHTNIEIPGQKERGTRFIKDHSLSYPGELLERFDERGLVNDDKTLFTLMFAVSSFNNIYQLQTFNNQREIYKRKIFQRVKSSNSVPVKVLYLSELTNEFDQEEFDLACSLYDSSASYSLYEYLLILDLAQNRLGYLKRKPGCEKYETIQNISKENIERDLLKAINTSKNLKVYENEWLLQEMTFIYERYLKKPKSSDFKTKYFGSFLQSWGSLWKRQITPNDLENIRKFMDITEKELLYLNFMHVERNLNESRLSRPKQLELAVKMATAHINDAAAVPEEVKVEITDYIVKAKGDENFYSFIYDCFSEVKGDAQDVNYTYITGLINEELKSSKYCRLSNIQVLFSKDMFEKLCTVARERLIRHHATWEQDTEVLKRVKSIAEEYKVDILDDFYTLERYCDKQIVDIYELVETSEKNKYLCNAIKYIIKGDILQKVEGLLKLANSNNTDHRMVLDNMLAIRASSLKDIPKEKAQAFLNKVENLYFIHNTDTYPKHIYSCLNDKDYTEIMDITEEEKIVILKTYSKSKLLDEATRKNISMMFMTEEEKQEVFKQEKIQKIHNQSCMSYLRYEYERGIKNPDVAAAVKKRMVILSDAIKKSYDDEKFKLLYMLVKDNLITPEEVYYIMAGREYQRELGLAA